MNKEVTCLVTYDDMFDEFGAVMDIEGRYRIRGWGQDRISAIEFLIEGINCAFLYPDYTVGGELLETEEEPNLSVLPNNDTPTYEDEEDEDYFEEDEEPGLGTAELRDLLIKVVFDDEPVPKRRVGKWDELYAKAFNFMAEKHFGQKDKAGVDYYLHPFRVASRCEAPHEKVIALLHDTLEDTDATTDNLREIGCPEELVGSVAALTHKGDESYRDYICRAKEDQNAYRVKIADLSDNMDLTRLKEVTGKDLKRYNKYLHAWRYLHGHDEDLDLITD